MYISVNSITIISTEYINKSLGTYSTTLKGTGHQLELLSPLIVLLQVFASQKLTKKFYA